MGYIYLLTCKVNAKKYVGQTSRSPDERFNEHKDSAAHYARYLANPEKYVWKGSCTYLYRSMIKHGCENFTMEVLAEVDDSELDALEIKFIAEIGTLAPGGYNLTTGGGHYRHCDRTKQMLSEKVKAAMLADIDKFRTSPNTIGMPAYIAYKDIGSYKAYYINNHPRCQRKYFSEVTHGSIEAAKNACIEYVHELEALSEERAMQLVEKPMKGIRKVANGYRARKIINGVSYEKSFTNKTKSDDENLQSAKDYIKNLQ